MKKTIVGLMLTMFILSSISRLAGLVRAQELVPPGAEILYMRTTFPKTDFGGNLLIEVAAKEDSNKNIIGAEAKLDMALIKCSGPMPVVNRVEINRAASATNPNIMSIPINAPQDVKGKTVRITNVGINVSTQAAQSIFSNLNGLFVTVFTTPGPPDGTFSGPLIPANEPPPPNFVQGRVEGLVCPSLPDHYANRIVGGFNLIREDSTPDNFNTYGFNFDYTRFLTPHVGVTGDFNVNFRTLGGVDLTKTSVLGGITILPLSGAMTRDKVTFSTEALVGVSHLTSSFGSVSVSDNAFTMKLGGAVDINVNQHVFIRPIAFYYNPTFFGGNPQNNVQLNFGAGFRF